MMGAVESLTKPVDRGLLHEVVSRHISAGSAKVLIVDDDPDSRSLMARYAEAEGWSFSEAENGAVALTVLEEMQPLPDLILLDLMMPVMDGFEFIERVRSRDEYRNIQIVVVSAKTLTPEDQLRLRGTVERVIEKGQSTADEVLNYVRKLRPPQAEDA